MGPPSYFVKIRKRTIAILPPPPKPNSPSLYPDSLPMTNRHELRNTWSCRSIQLELHNVHQQMCMTTKHISHPPCLITHSSATNMAMDDKQEPYFNQSEDAISYLSTSWNSRINEGKDYRVPILPLANELPYPGDNEYRQYFNDTAVLQRTTSRHLIRKSRILINQGLSISSSRTIESHAQRTINHLYNKDCRTFTLNHHYASTR